MNPAVTRSFLEGLITVNAAFFLFQTQSHDRYAYPLSVFLLLWLPFLLGQESATRRQNTIRILPLFVLLYSCFTAFYFYNLHTALVINYPENGLPVLSGMTGAAFSVPNAFILTGLFVVYLAVLARSSAQSGIIVAGSITLIAASLVWLNTPLILRQPVPLTKLTPYISEQTYGTRQKNRTVQSSFGGPYTWNRLSVQYLFYENGIGSHANSRYVYDINRKFSSFSFDYGIDTESGPKASVEFIVLGDGRQLYRSQKMGRYDIPRHEKIDVSGIKFLTLTITDAGDGNYDDHANWLNPTLWP
jgi:hypothetical protein